MSPQDQDSGKPSLSFKRIALALKGGRKTGLTKEFSRPQIAEFERITADEAVKENPVPIVEKPRTFRTGESAMLKVRVTLEANKPVGTRREFELLRMRLKLPTSDPKHLSDDELDHLMKEQLDAAAKRWNMQKANRTFSQVEYNNTRQQIYSFTVMQPPDRRIAWIKFTYDAGIINDIEYDMSLAKAIHDAREKWTLEDTTHQGNPLERRRARRAVEHIFQSIGEERSDAIIEKSKS